MRSPLDAVPGGVITLSSDMRILAANQAVGDMLGRHRDELIGQPIDLLLTAPSRILFQTHVYPALKGDGRVEEVFLTLTTATGQIAPVLLNAAPTPHDPASYQALLVRVLARSRWETDLLATTRALERQRAESKRLNDELTTAARELEARYADEQRLREFREAFIGVISHELRSPITAIYGLSHILRERHRSLGPEALDGHLQDMSAEADRLRRLTEDLLVMSRAEGGKLAVGAEPVAVRHVAAVAVENEASRAVDHSFTLDAPPGAPLVRGEELYVEQVIRNFLSNAAKYSPRGTTIHTSVTEESGGAAVRVEDEGPGLPEPRERLFELFYRSPEAIGQAPGAGIGLFVCRELVRAMGGRIWAESAADGGAVFGFWLPGVSEDDEVVGWHRAGEE